MPRHYRKPPQHNAPVAAPTPGELPPEWVAEAEQIRAARQLPLDIPEDKRFSRESKLLRLLMELLGQEETARTSGPGG